MKRAVPQSWGTSNGTFDNNKMGDIQISFVEYLTIIQVSLKPDIVKHDPGGPPPTYDLIIGKETLHKVGLVLDFKGKTI